MSVNDFLTKINVQLLWEVVTDDDLLQNQPNEILQQISNTFEKNIRGFNEVEKKTSSNLMNMNKKFISLIMNRANVIISQSQNKNKNKKEIITSSDLQTERQTIFEKELSQKQNEFSNAMSLPVPPVPKFTDDNLDKPINEMELEIKKALEQRKYDVEQLNKTLSNTNADSWLKSQDTSIKNEKLVPQINKNNSIKYIKINNENIENSIIKKDIIDLAPKKHISWQDENISLNMSSENEDILFENNIFKKLKKITPEKSQEITITRLSILEEKIEEINNNINLILQLLQKK
jgi:hypothetical protein